MSSPSLPIVLAFTGGAGTSSVTDVTSNDPITGHCAKACSVPSSQISGGGRLGDGLYLDTGCLERCVGTQGRMVQNQIPTVGKEGFSPSTKQEEGAAAVVAAVIVIGLILYFAMRK